MVLGLCALVCLVGLLMYALSVNSKLIEIGRIMFFAGLLALLLVGDRALALLKG
jgi:hypothetical protein